MLLSRLLARPSASRAQWHQLRRLESTQQSSSTAAAILSKPTWSLKSLLPPTRSEPPDAEDPTTSTSTSSSEEKEITPAQLHHLLRLSALPPPASPAAEAAMLRTLSSQIHFVRAVQAVDTAGVEPLRGVRDETGAATAEATVGLERMRAVLEGEEVVGRNGRIRRKKTTGLAHESQRAGEFGEDGWDPLDLAQERRGRFFVVKRTRNKRDQQLQVDPKKARAERSNPDASRGPEAD